jgi:hypothetical protein
MADVDGGQHDPILARGPTTRKFCRAKRKERLLFVNKKKQKNFYMLGHGRCRRHCPWPSIEEVFAPLFSKSGRLPLSEVPGLDYKPR